MSRDDEESLNVLFRVIRGIVLFVLAIVVINMTHNYFETKLMLEHGYEYRGMYGSDRMEWHRVGSAESWEPSAETAPSILVPPPPDPPALRYRTYEFKEPQRPAPAA
jgi:hypothetical protein